MRKYLAPLLTLGLLASLLATPFNSFATTIRKDKAMKLAGRIGPRKVARKVAAKEARKVALRKHRRHHLRRTRRHVTMRRHIKK